MNRIYIVRHKKNKKYFILKKISLDNEEKQIREIEVHKTLNYKYVISLVDYEIKKENKQLYILLEFARFGDLFTFLRKSKLTNRKILKFYYKIIQSVKYLHDKTLVHRDIKPENIFITQNYRPKLGDFGTSGRET